jgi:hypothetical protein
MKDPVGCRYWTEPERAFEGPTETNELVSLNRH